MLKFGTISEVDPKGFVRVRFDEDDIVSQPLQVVFRRTFKDKDYMLPDLEDHVACVMDEYCENGVCIGAIYSDEDAAPFDTENISGIKFQNGDEISYDREEKLFKVKISTLEFKISQTGFTMKKGTETLKKLIKDLIAANKAATYANGAGTTGPAINIAQFTAIETRVDSFFEE